MTCRVFAEHTVKAVSERAKLDLQRDECALLQQAARSKQRASTRAANNQAKKEMRAASSSHLDREGVGEVGAAARQSRSGPHNLDVGVRVAELRRQLDARGRLCTSGEHGVTRQRQSLRVRSSSVGNQMARGSVTRHAARLDRSRSNSSKQGINAVHGRKGNPPCQQAASA